MKKDCLVYSLYNYLKFVLRTSFIDPINPKTSIMELTFQTPALLFPALSLLILAYTNKFLAIANLVRKLYSDHQEKPQQVNIQQITSLRRRLNMIRWMQAAGLASIFFCVVTMFFVYFEMQLTAKILFVIALVLLMLSLVVSVLEMFLSADALNVLLSNIEELEADEPNRAQKTVKKIGSASARLFSGFLKP